MAENTLVDKILALQDKYNQLQNQLSDPEVIADMKKYVQLNKDYKELQPIIKAGLEYKKLVDELAEAKDILVNEKDEDLRDMAKAEVAEIEPKLPQMEEEIKILLIPADPDDSKNAIVEIRGGAGGDEAAIFAGDLFRMYSKYAEKRGWKIEINDQAPGTSGGYKLIVFNMNPASTVYSAFHRPRPRAGSRLLRLPSQSSRKPASSMSTSSGMTSASTSSAHRDREVRVSTPPTRPCD